MTHVTTTTTTTTTTTISTTTRRAAALLAGVTGLLAGAVALAPPAAAEAPTVVYITPTENQIVSTAAPGVSADVRMVNGGTITERVRLLVRSLEDDGREPVIRDVAGSNTSSQRVTFTVSLTYNGKYQAVISATGVDPAPDINGSETRNEVRTFYVAAPPSPPRGLRATVTDDREVSLAWGANPEPDVLGYRVQRSRDGAAFEAVADTTGTSYKDAGTTAGGEYRYTIIAVRRGATPTEGVVSDPSASTTASVPVPTTTAAAGSGGSGGGSPGSGGSSSSTTGGGGSSSSSGSGTTSRTAFASSGRVSLSQDFSSLLRRAQAQSTPPQEADTGFEQSLPFARSEGEAPEEAELGAEESASGEVQELGIGDESDDRQRSLSFVAGGLLVTVVLMHLLWVKSQVDKEPLEALAPDDD